MEQTASHNRSANPRKNRIRAAFATVPMLGWLAGILAAVSTGAGGLGYDVFYIFAAIAFGSMFGSWMNDSGFWIVCKMTGFTEAETLKTWTLLVSVISLVGLVEVMIASTLVPHPFG